MFRHYRSQYSQGALILAVVPYLDLCVPQCFLLEEPAFCEGSLASCQRYSGILGSLSESRVFLINITRFLLDLAYSGVTLILSPVLCFYTDLGRLNFQNHTLPISFPLLSHFFCMEHTSVGKSRFIVVHVKKDTQVMIITIALFSQKNATMQL